MWKAKKQGQRQGCDAKAKEQFGCGKSGGGRGRLVWTRIDSYRGERRQGAWSFSSASRKFGLSGVGMKIIDVGQGRVELGREGEMLWTLLGSCIGVILTDGSGKIAAMCHIVMANPPASGSGGDCKFGDAALEKMEALLRVGGAGPGKRIAYVAGGGNMFPSVVKRLDHVGEINAKWVLDRLVAMGVKVAMSDVSGNMYRTMEWVVGVGLPVVKSTRTD